MKSSRRRALAATALLAAAPLMITACAGADADSSSATEAAGDVIVAAADPSLLPYNFVGDDGKTWEGLNISLAEVLSEKLGRTIRFEAAGFDTIIPGLTSGRYDLALTGMFDTQERQKTVDFVDYLLAENNFLTREGYREIVDMDDLCGEKVGIPSGAIEGGLLAEASERCVVAGEAAIDVAEYSDLDAVVLALTSQRIDVAPNDSAANAYIVKNAKGLVTSGGYLNEGYFAAAFAKDSDLTAEFEAAFAEIMADGSYAEVLEEWGIPSRGMDEPIINGSPF